MKLKEVTAIVTGASGQLGQAIALGLAGKGCNCICHCHSNTQRAEELVKQIEALGAKALAVQADLRDESQIKLLFDKAQQLGVPQILVNSAAVFSKQPLEDLTFGKCREVLELNLIAAIMTSQAFTQIIKKNFADTKEVVAKIINISDVGGIRPWAGFVAYCCSKAGLIAATKAMAKELAPTICVNSVAPGLVTWPADFDDARKKRQLGFIPAARPAKLEEIADAVISLVENDYITGQVLNVDGGRCI